MRLKSYFAGTVEAALGLAREELGEEAVLVESRKAPPEAQHLGEYEVVVASLDPREAERVTAAGPGERAGSGAASAELEGCKEEMAVLRREMERLRAAIWQSAAVARGAAPAMPGGREALGTLLEAGMDPPLAHEIAACVEARRVGDPLLAELGEAAGARSRSGRKGSGWKGNGAGWNPALSEEAVGGAQEAPEAPRGGVAAKSGAEAGDWRTLLREELERRIDAEATVGRPEARFRAAALVGPPGSGKTTALVKLAVREGLEKRRAVRIVSLDTYRVAATEPLRTYAAILGVNFRTADNPAALGQALVGAGERDLVLIDTPGLAPGESEAAAEVARILLRYPEIEVQLTLGTTTRYADLTSAVDRFEMFRPSKLLFTRLDEATSFGAAFSQAVRTGRPVSFLAVGPRVPEDLEEASRSRLIGLLLG